MSDQDHQLMGLVADDVEKMKPSTPEERFIADHLQQLLVSKELPPSTVVGVMMKMGENDVRLYSLGAEELELDDPADLLPFLVEGTKRHGPPAFPDLDQMIGIVLVTSGGKLADEESSKAYLDVRSWRIEVRMQDFPDCVRTRMAIMGDGRGKVFIACMSEDDQGIQAFEPTVVAPRVEVNAENPLDTDDGIGGKMADLVDELARLFRKGDATND